VRLAQRNVDDMSKKRKKPKYLKIIPVVIIVLLVAVTVVLAAGETMPRSTFSSGGGLVSGTNLQSNTMMGMPVSGAVSESGGSATNCVGFWCVEGVTAPTPTVGPTATATPGPTPTPQPGDGFELYLPVTVK
jgi:hypothetical protein